MPDLEAKLDPFATAEEIAAVTSVLSELGIESEVEGGYKKFRYGELTGEADEPEWIIVLILSGTFGGFLTGFFGEAGKDAWRRLKHAMKELRDTRRKPTGPVIPPSPPHVGSVYIRDQYGNELGFGVYPKMEGDEFWRAWETIHEPDWSALGGWHVLWDEGQWTAIEPLPSKGRVVRWDREQAKWLQADRPVDQPRATGRGRAHR